MRGVFTAVWFLGVMSIGAVAGVELAHYRQGQLMREAQAGSQARSETARPVEPVLAEALPSKSKPAPPPRAVIERLAKPEPSRTAPRLAETSPPAPAIEPSPPPKQPAAPPLQHEPIVPPPLPPASAPPASTELAGQTPPPAPLEIPRPRVRIVISLPTQRAFVFRDGELWDSSRVSTGKKGKRTPVGTFTILEKAVWHRSNKYSNAPMPYMQRITWGGVALHAGVVPGYPASHGCIRLPRSFAKRLYNITNFSSTVVVTDKRIASAKDAQNAS